MKPEFSAQIFEKYSNVKCNNNPSSEGRVVRRGRTDGRQHIDGQAEVRKPVVAFRSFAKMPKTRIFKYIGVIS